MTHAFRFVARCVVLLFLLYGWLLLADHFFDSPTTAFNVDYEHGLAAVGEQLAAALFTPAWFVCELLSASQSRFARGPMFLLSVLQLWPLFVFVYRPWPILPRLLQRGILIYSGLCFIASTAGFIILHNSWDKLFGS